MRYGRQHGAHMEISNTHLQIMDLSEELGRIHAIFNIHHPIRSTACLVILRHTFVRPGES